MAFVWVLIGIVYVIYKLQKEEKFFTRDMILPGIIFAVGIIIISLLNNVIETADDPAVSLTALLIMVVPIGIAVLIITIGLIWNAIDESKPSIAQKTEFFPVGYYSHDDIDILKRKFAQNGYPNINVYDIADLIFCGPLKNSNKKCLHIDECIDWLSEHATTKMERMNIQELQAQIGIPLCVLPEYPYTIKEAYTTRREVAHIIGFILHKQGLRYQKFGGHRVFKEEEFKKYFQTLSRFITQYKEDYGTASVSEITVDKSKTLNPKLMQLRFRNYGYGDISLKEIENLVSAPDSCLNEASDSQIPLSDCYVWMCKQASDLLDKLSRPEIESNIGLPIINIPLNPNPQYFNAEEDRLIHIKSFILEDRGLKYYYNTGYSKNIVKDSDYKNLCSDFIKHNSSH